MKLHLDPETFRDAVLAAANDLNIRDVYVEKDYWITFVLWRLSRLENSQKFVFKGGTSLSKAHGLIERFSEDIDLALTEIESLSGNQVKSLIDKASKILTANPLVENSKNSKMTKGSRFRRTVHKYPSLGFETELLGASPDLLLEINSFAKPEPAVLCSIQSYVGQFFLKKSPGDISRYDLESFSIRVLAMERTYIEKAMGLIRHSFDGADPLREKIRHLYDIAKLDQTTNIQLLKTNPKKAAEIVDKVRASDKNNKDFAGPWLDEKLSDAPLFKNIHLKAEMKRAYEANEFQSLIWNKTIAPNFESAWKALMSAREILH